MRKHRPKIKIIWEQITEPDDAQRLRQAFEMLLVKPDTRNCEQGALEDKLDKKSTASIMPHACPGYKDEKPDTHE